MKKRASTGSPTNLLGALRYGLIQSFKSPATLGIMAAPLAAMGVKHYETKRRDRMETQQKAVAYRQMMDLHPHFKQRDQADIGRVYNSLHNVSPHMARDPLVAGAWVDNVLENRVPGMNSHQALLNAVKDLSGIQKNVSEIERNRVQSPMADKAERWVRDYSQSFHDGMTNGYKQLHQQHANKMQREQDKIQRATDKLRSEEFKVKHRQNMSRIESAAEELQREREEFDAIRESFLENMDRDKKSSARTPLGEMLRALKV